MSGPVFDIYSNYYDLLYKDKNYKEEVSYVESLVKKNLPGAQTILELGCGTGIHAQLFAEQGFTVTGVDLSETMLDKANIRRNNLPLPMQNKLNFTHGDIRNISLGRKFDAVISLFHVMSYMQTNADLSSVIDGAAKHLSEEGLFIFDCWHGPGVLNDPPVSRKKYFENDLLRVTRTSTPTHLTELNTVVVDFDVEIFNKTTQEKSILAESHRMRYLFEEELVSLAKQSGLKFLDCLAWLENKEAAENNWYACYIFRKQG